MFDNNNSKKYSEKQIEQLRSTSMRDILAAEGFDTTHTRGGLYFSPFREKERTPSFHIDDANHRWYDHGDPSLGAGVAKRNSSKGGGDVVAFVMLLKGCGFLDALDYLCRYNPTVVPEKKVTAIAVPRGGDRIIAEGNSRSDEYLGTIIRQARTPFVDATLVAFAEGRGIPRAILERYCKEVYYDMRYCEEGGGQRIIGHHAIGFPNSDGGWVLRYLPKKGDKRGKRSTGGGATLLSKDGTLAPAKDAKATAPSVVVFEGFMDFLSWITEKRSKTAVPTDTDAVVLNSVANLDTALPFLLQHKNIIGLLDDDDTGERTTLSLKAAAERAGQRFHDWRRLFEGYKDYNEAWQRRCLLKDARRA